MTLHTPYTYLLIFNNPELNQKFYYYGVEYKKSAHPDNFWNQDSQHPYFTSSKHILKLRKQFGDDVFEFQIRKTFDSASNAKKWESSVIRRMNAVKSDNWLNKANNGTFFVTDEVRKNMKGKIFSAEHRRRISESNKGRIVSQETRLKMSLARKGKKRLKPVTDETRKKISDAHKGIQRFRIVSDETREKLRNGRLGKKQSVETRQKISAGKTGPNNIFYGKKRPEHAIKMQTASAKQWRVVFPDKSEQIVTHLPTFCQINGLDVRNLRRGRKSKQYRAYRI